MANARQTVHKLPVSSPFECIALLLQGGGALGAYQAGVYEALSEARLQPDWVAGISIGAINAALIAGNTPERRVANLRTFWERITPVQPLDSIAKLGPVSWMRGELSRGLLNHMSAGTAMLDWRAELLRATPPGGLVAPVRIAGGDQLLRHRATEIHARGADRLRPAQFRGYTLQRGCSQCHFGQLRLFRQHYSQDQTRTCDGERRVAARLAGNRDRG